MKKITGLLQLYRIDSFVITVFSFFITLFIVKSNAFSFPAVLLGFSLGVIFVNFIYSFNSYYDADIDAINKPSRPIPSGVISKQEARKYILTLGVASLFFPCLFFYNKTVFVILYIFPVIGILYSNPVFPFKKKPILASLTTACILVLPATVAMLYSNNFWGHWQFLLLLFGYCFFLVPLKDIEDVKGDTAFNSGNWAQLAGEKKLLLFSLTGLTVLLFVAFTFRSIAGFLLLGGIFMSSVFVELYFLFRKESFTKLYKTLILSNLALIVIGLIAFIVRWFFANEKM